MNPALQTILTWKMSVWANTAILSLVFIFSTQAIVKKLDTNSRAAEIRTTLMSNRLEASIDKEQLLIEQIAAIQTQQQLVADSEAQDQIKIAALIEQVKKIK